MGHYFSRQVLQTRVVLIASQLISQSIEVVLPLIWYITVGTLVCTSTLDIV